MIPNQKAKEDKYYLCIRNEEEELAKRFKSINSLIKLYQEGNHELEKLKRFYNTYA